MLLALQIKGQQRLFENIKSKTRIQTIAQESWHSVAV